MSLTIDGVDVRNIVTPDAPLVGRKTVNMRVSDVVVNPQLLALIRRTDRLGSSAIKPGDIIKMTAQRDPTQNGLYEVAEDHMIKRSAMPGYRAPKKPKALRGHP